jgi:UDP-2,3-diacylglucosamine pyrophosphatase LpxH
VRNLPVTVGGVIRKYRTGWISDVHLGTKGCQAEALLHFLKVHEFETLYIVGDLLDLWALKRGIYWPQTHNDVLQKILRAGRKGTRVIYIPGNHDEFVAGFFGDYGAVTVQERAVHTTADGRRLLVFHGHELDVVVQNGRWLAHLGDVGYTLLLRLNAPINWCRKKLGFNYWSLSAAAKRQIKSAVNYIGAFQEAVVRLARMEDNIHGVVCGHIHTPTIGRIGAVEYFNAGDWVESLSALVEEEDGSIRLLCFQDLISHVPGTSLALEPHKLLDVALP